MKILLCHHMNKLYTQYIAISKCNIISQYWCFQCIFDQINSLVFDQDICSPGQKYRHPCKSVRKCNPSLRKLLQLQTFWYSHVYFFVCIGTQKTEEKLNLIQFTQNPKNALDKIIGTLNLILGSTPFGKNNWNQSLPVTMNEFLTPLYWNFGPLFFCKLLQVIQIWRMPSPNCCFEISPQVFYGIQIWTYCWPFQNSPALCL